MILAGAAVAALLLWPRRAAAAAPPSTGTGITITFPDHSQFHPAPDWWTPGADYFDPVYGESWAGDVDAEVSDPGITPAWADDLDQLGVGLPDFYAPTTMELADDPQVAAFLYAIRRAEHSAADVAAGLDYRTFYSGIRFTNMADHPVNTGELQGVKLSAAMCRAAGFPSGNCVSTAAGAYQITRPTWNEFRALEPRVPDFSPRSQDIVAARILMRLGVHRLLRSGDFAGAVYRASSRWASLPGSTAKQGGRTMEFVAQAFQQAGGNLA